MPADVSIAVRDLRALVEDGEITPKFAEKAAAALAAVDGGRNIVNQRADSAASQVESVVKVLSRHMRRYPNTDCALALTLVSYFAGQIGAGEYLR